MLRDLSDARTIWISDLHLGTRDCQAARLSAFLKCLPKDWSGHLYLVGDAIDFWALKKFFYWPTEHNLLIQKILRISRNGAKITFIPGNHDEDARAYCGNTFGGVELELEAIHTAADGKKYLVTHGDQYDSLLKNTLFSGEFLAWGAGILSILGHRVNRLGWWPHMSLREHVIRWFGGAGANHRVFRKAASLDAAHRGYDGVICGHIHEPEILPNSEGVTYLNCGDWTESCTALVEDESGAISLTRF